MKYIVVILLLMVVLSSASSAEPGKYQLIPGKCYIVKMHKTLGTENYQEKYRDSIFKIDTEAGKVWEWVEEYKIDVKGETIDSHYFWRELKDKDWEGK